MHKKGGGVDILVSKKLRYTELHDISSNMVENEVVTIEISLRSGKKCIVSSMYRAPNTTVSAFQCFYNSLLYAMRKTNPYAIIVGLDHNLDFLKADKHAGTKDFIHNSLDMGMVPTITKPTQITKSSTTLIDNIIVSENLCGKFDSNILINDISDHMPTVCVIRSLNTVKREPVVITSRDTRTKNVQALKAHLASYDWQHLLQSKSVDTNLETLQGILQLKIDRCTPVKSRTINYKQIRREPWVTAQLHQSIKKCKVLYSDAMKSPANVDLNERYKNYQRVLKRAIRAAKIVYHNNKCEEYKNNTK